jgi:hypothetical protein
MMRERDTEGMLNNGMMRERERERGMMREE